MKKQVKKISLKKTTVVQLNTAEKIKIEGGSISWFTCTTFSRRNLTCTD
ncbi:MAG: class I lanthipeptide [Dinghuibacter sp.]|nr:class I lanthipeptide [Dinghuibacter sp.]